MEFYPDGALVSSLWNNRLLSPADIVVDPFVCRDKVLRGGRGDGRCGWSHRTSRDLDTAWENRPHRRDGLDVIVIVVVGRHLKTQVLRSLLRLLQYQSGSPNGLFGFLAGFSFGPLLVGFRWLRRVCAYSTTGRLFLFSVSFHLSGRNVNLVAVHQVGVDLSFIVWGVFF